MKDRIFTFTFIVIAFFVLGFTISRAVFKSPEQEKDTAAISASSASEISEEKLAIEESIPSGEEVAANSTETAGELPPIAENKVEPAEPVITITIKDTPTGWLNVREGPGITYAQVKRINPGETYNFLEEKFDWYKIRLNDTTAGWIASQYATKSK